MRITRLVSSTVVAASLLAGATPVVSQAVSQAVSPTVRSDLAANLSSRVGRDAPVGRTELPGRPVRLQLHATPLEAALLDIAAQAELRLTYSRETLPADWRVTATTGPIPAGEAFGIVLRGTDLVAHLAANGRVTITRRPVRAAPVSAVREVPLRPVDIAAVPRTTTRGVMVSTVRGHVTEAGSGRPLGGVQVSLDGTSRSAITNMSGDYLMVDVPDGSYVIRAQQIGFSDMSKSIDVQTGRATVADFALQPAAVELDAIVVTGTPGAASRRSLGNAVTTVNAATLVEKMTVKTVTELLQAQAPGVTILSSSGTPGSAGTIQIRGQSSLSAGLQPVIYIDGVRVHSGAAASFRNDWRAASAPGQRMTGAAGANYGSGQEASAIAMINPEDIESIEIIKGPAAATLYGAEAANGVIQIITKKGRPGEQRLQWTARAQAGRTSWSLDRLTNHTQCTPERIAARTPGTNTAVWPGCQGVPPNSIISLSPLSEPGVLRDGLNQNYSLSVNGGGANYSFYANVTHDNEEGVEHNSEFERTSARANFMFNPIERLDFNVSFNYVRDNTTFPQGNNAGNLIESAWTFVPGASGLSRLQLSDNFVDQSRQFAVYENLLEGDRVVFGTTVNYRPFQDFIHRLTVGGDIATRQSERWIAPNSTQSPTEGQLTQGSPKNSVFTVDYTATLRNRLSTTVGSALSFGAQYSNSRYENTVAQGTGFVSGATRAVGLSTTRSSWTELSEVKTLGFYLQEQVQLRDQLFLTGALRMDNSSVFGEDIRRIIYPKLSASYVVPTASLLPSLTVLDQLRLRAAWGQAGNAPGPFAAVRTYTFAETIDPLTGERGLALVRNTKGNPNLKPERGSEIEAGFDVSLLENRLGLELTYYAKNTHDALIPVPIPAAEGYAISSYLDNIGHIRNRGVEAAVNATPLQAGGVTWNMRLGFSTNSNELVDFGRENPATPFGLTAAVQRNIAGYPLGGYWVRDPVLRPGEDPALAGSYDGSELRFLGPSVPSRTASLSNTLQLPGNLTAFVLLDYKGGNYLYNHSRQRRCAVGVCAEVNDPGLSATDRAKLTTDIQNNTALYTEKADFIKLRDVSLRFAVPPAWIGRMQLNSAAITLAAHNLGFLYKPYNGPDPETNFVGINDPGAEWAGVRADYWNQPMFRRISIALDVGF